MPVYKKVNTDFFKKWTPVMAYVLGFFAADGYITHTKRGGQYWNIQITDRSIVENIRKAVESNHVIGSRISKKESHNTLYRLQVGSKEMCSDLRKLGMSARKTKNVTVPNVPSKFLGDFVRGYFDGDGNIWMGQIHTNRQTQHSALLLAFTSNSRDFLKQLQDRLVDNEIIGGSLFEPKNGFHRLQYSTKNALKIYDFMYNRLVSNALYLERKKAVFEKYKSVAGVA